MQERLSRRGRTPSPIFEGTTSPGSTAFKIVLGLDPSLRGTGYGAAQKMAVAKMVQRMLRLPAPPPPDAADALALALAFAQSQGRYGLSPPKKI